MANTRSDMHIKIIYNSMLCVLIIRANLSTCAAGCFHNDFTIFKQHYIMTSITIQVSKGFTL